MDVSIGRYVAGRSIVHRLDPRTKICIALAVAVGILQGKSLAGTGIHLLAVLLVLACAGLPWRFVLRSIRPFIWLALIVLLSHLLASGLGAWGTGVALGGRLLAMVVLASALSWTTRPLDIVAGLRSLGAPLARVGVPVDAGATAVGLALRFAPIALSEAQTIIRAQAARGADFRGLRRKAALVVPLLGTLFERAFMRADALAEAMEARGYDPRSPRTYYRQLGWHVRDLVAGVLVAGYLFGAVMVDRGGW